MIYLASPYACNNQNIINSRVDAVTKAAAALMNRGEIVYSPIVHGHAVQAHLNKNLACDHKFWLVKDFPFIINSRGVYILKIPGWKESKGVRWEAETAWAFGLPVHLYDPENSSVTELDRDQTPWGNMGQRVDKVA